MDPFSGGQPVPAHHVPAGRQEEGGAFPWLSGLPVNW